MIAALYIDPRGPYPRMAGVDCWDAARDARNYPGPWPVVAHTPCGPWGCLKHLCTKQDSSLGPIAVGQVRHFGGVLEHPAHSGLFDFMRMPRPGELPDAFGGYTVQVNQVDFGHCAKKPTWLYFVGVAPTSLVFPSEPGVATHWIGGSRGRGRTRQGSPLPPGIKAASSQLRRRTPPGFAYWLVELARTVRVREAA